LRFQQFREKADHENRLAIFVRHIQTSHSINVEVPTSGRLPVAVFSVQYWSLLARGAE
jgi:hypothetical protein